MNLNNDNYYSREADMEYMSVSQFKSFVGSYGRQGCEFETMEKLAGRWEEETTTPMLIGSYVDSFIEGKDAFKKFCMDHLDLYKADGTLKATYAIGETVIKRITRDDYFMWNLSGEKQTIMTGEIGGAKWKIKMDSYLPGNRIVDLKVVKDLTEHHYVRDLGYIDFIDYWGYDTQGAVYQEIVRQNTGEKLPFFIAGVSKEKYPAMQVIGISQAKLDEALTRVKVMMPRILDVKSGRVPPDRCERCDCCRDSAVLTNWIPQDMLLAI